MNICMFIRSLPAHAIGGMELHVETLCQTLVSQGHSVEVITTGHPNGTEKENKKGVSIHYLKGTTPGKYSGAWQTKGLECFERLHAQRPFDVVHGQSAGTYYFLKKSFDRKFNVPVVVSLHGTSVDEIKTKLRLGLNLRAKAGLLKNIYHYLLWDRFYLRRCAAVIVTSDSQVQVINRYFPVTPDKVSVVYNGIDVDLFKPSGDHGQLRAKLGIPSDAPVVLSVARLKREKGVQNILNVFVKIAESIRDVRLVVVGKGEYHESLIRLASDLGISDRVCFAGAVNYYELPAYFNMARVFVNSTIRENGYDLTIPQAMACARPVITSDIKSVFTLIRDSVNGIIYPRNNLDTLKNNVLNILMSPDSYLEMGSRARTTVENGFGLKTMAEKTIAVYKKAMGEFR